MARENDDLLKILPGETEEEAIKRWWEDNGLDHDKARLDRKETYAKQKEEWIRTSSNRTIRWRIRDMG